MHCDHIIELFIAIFQFSNEQMQFLPLFLNSGILNFWLNVLNMESGLHQNKTESHKSAKVYFLNNCIFLLAILIDQQTVN
jgi:hypothetical protein